LKGKFGKRTLKKQKTERRKKLFVPWEKTGAQQTGTEQ